MSKPARGWPALLRTPSNTKLKGRERGYTNMFEKRETSAIYDSHLYILAPVVSPTVLHRVHLSISLPPYPFRN